VTCNEDEYLRKLASDIGVDSIDRVCHLQTIAHAHNGLDQRAMECFDKFVNDGEKSTCASEVLLKVVKLRMVIHIRNGAQSAAVSLWNPQTVSWLTSRNALNTASNGETKLVIVPLTSTRSLLNKILPFLPRPTTSEAQAEHTLNPRSVKSVTSHYERGMELVVLTEALLDSS
jgi:hypothetical protein